MARRLKINEITSKTIDWKCKIQVVDKGFPHDAKDKSTKYQLLTLQDEEETQIQAIIFNNDIAHFKELFKPFYTYLVSLAYVKDSPYEYGTPIHKYQWTIDRGTIVEPIDKVTPPEDPLPPPTRLTVTPFDTFEFQDTEIDVLAIVVNGSPPTYATNGRRVQNFIIMDSQKKPVKFTLWEEFIEHYGCSLKEQLHEYPVILARKVGKSSSSSTSSGTPNKFYGLSNKFGSTIHINPPYSQAVALRAWAKRNEQKLIEYTAKSTTAKGFIQVVPFEEILIPISTIHAQPLGQAFYVEAEVLLDNENQQFYVMHFSKCKQMFRRALSRMTFYCSFCKEYEDLIPRCQFEVTLRDNTGSTVATISDELAEKILQLNVEEVYNICFIQKTILPWEKIQQQLSGKIFKIQIKKLFTKNLDTTPKLSILSYEEKIGVVHPEMPSTMTEAIEGSKRKIQHIDSMPKQEEDNTSINAQRMRTSSNKKY